jgi:hypothetical protein
MPTSRRAAALLLALAAPLGAQSSPDPVRWRGTLAAGKTIEVIGVLGSIRAVPAEGREVVVEARQLVRGATDTITFEVLPHADGVTICAKYPMRRIGDDEDGSGVRIGGDGRPGWEGGPDECEPGEVGNVNLRRNRTRVEWTVRVPAGVRFSGRTVDGDVEARDLRGDVDANTVSGDVDVSTTGVAEAATVSGDIRVAMGSRWARPLDFRTVSGGIDVTFPPRLDGEVRASSFSGSITADFPLERSGRSFAGGGRASATLGKGGPTLYAQTLSGRIRFHTAAP